MHRTGTGRLRAGIEAGGSKVVCAVGIDPDDVAASVTLPTTTPQETLGHVIDWLHEQEAALAPIEAIGIASFGPLDLREESPTYGSITATPKPGWAGTDLLGPLRDEFNVAVGIDTDVNGAALAEHRWGATIGLSATAHVAVGTGVGGGGTIDGQPLHGLMHPEMGHLPVRRHPHDYFPGSCPFHGDCLEGLASGRAIEARFARPATDLGSALEPALVLEAAYLAQLVASIAYVLSPERITLGGGVLGLPGLMAGVRAATRRLLGGALPAPTITEDIDDYLVAPFLGDRAGVLGALLLAEQAAEAAARETT